MACLPFVFKCTLALFVFGSAINNVIQLCPNVFITLLQLPGGDEKRPRRSKELDVLIEEKRCRFLAVVGHCLGYL